MRILFLLAPLLGAQAPGGQEAAKPSEATQVVRIEENERVVHVLGTPFTHAYYESPLETFLVKRYAHRGLIYRRVDLDRAIENLVRDLDRRVLIHKPTLVVVQTGSEDLRSQYRRATFDFSGYPAALEAVVGKLREKKTRVILCSTVPVGSTGTSANLVPPLDGLKGWAEAARDVARRHDAVFVDLFAGALGWKMIGPGEYYYDTQGHERSWQLFCRQVRFEPSGSTVRIDAKGGTPRGEGARIENLKIEAAEVSLGILTEAGAGPVLLRVEGLREGSYALEIDDKPQGARSAVELAKGIELEDRLRQGGTLQDLKAELARGHKASAAYESILNYGLPEWVRVPDFEKQKGAALKGALDTLERHDAVVRDLVRPQVFSVRVKGPSDPSKK